MESKSHNWLNTDEVQPTYVFITWKFGTLKCSIIIIMAVILQQNYKNCALKQCNIIAEC